MTRSIRFIAVNLALALGLQLLPAFAFAFTDVKASTQYSTAIQELQSNGDLKGYANGTFKPGSTINRAEFVQVIANILAPKSNTLAECDNPATRQVFPDVERSAWYFRYICALNNQNIIQGYPDGMFHPEREINFVEAAKIIAGAYGQDAMQGGNEWYEGYVLALESSKAIPPSVTKLESFITRGEMAEMMWRLSEGKTTLASKGLLNLRNPLISINTASDAVQYPKSCADLQAFASATSASNSGPMYFNKGGEVMMRMEDAAGAAAPMAPAANQSTTAGSDYSQTNVQVAGVDEGDIVKTDGTFIYTVSRNNPTTVKIVRATPASSMKLESTIDLTTKNFSPTELYIDDGKLILLGQTWSGGGYPVPLNGGVMMEKMIAPGSTMPYYGGSQTQVMIYDVSNAASPKLERTVGFDGSSVSTRKIGNKLYLVLQQGFRYWGDPRIMMDSGAATTPATVVPQMEDSKVGKMMDVAPCTRIAILPHIPSPQYMTVAVIPTDDLSKDVKSTVVLGNAQNVYASLQNLYVATPLWNYVWDSANSQSQEKTHLYRFAFTDTGVELKAQGNVPGHILNQFSMDENGSTFRIATTIGQSWDSTNRSTNNVYVLNMNMEQTGAVTDIAPGETIYSVRFAGDRAYMVTFKTVDPFFVIDLSDPRAPKVLGALKIPGFSNYLHPYDATHVIGFGKDVDESIDADKVHSTDAIYYTAIQGLKMAMFDVTDVSNPKQMSVEVIGDRGTDSPLLTDHKALLFDKERNLLAFPILVTQRPADSAKSADGMPVFQGAYVYDVSMKGFTLRGKISHYDNTDEFVKAGSYWYGGEKDIQRIVRIGSSLLTLSDGQVRSNNETSVKEEGKVNLK
ncbi:hypothetical protein EXS70_00725 [Candidatus Peribacteria bacterium]|nr:hypothetical protein [Candidatus Peribacteria bacterium]